MIAVRSLVARVGVRPGRTPATGPALVTLALAAVWFATTAVSVSFVWKYRGPTPSGDEWFDVGHASGELPLDWNYLWRSANDHRVPFVRLLYAGIMRAFAFDFRTVAVANVLILSGAATVVMVVLRRRRGHSALSDAAIPLALTNLGMWEPFLWNALLHAAVGVSLTTITLLLVTRRDDPTAGRVTLVGGLGLLLLGCGGPGVPYLPALALWLGIVALWAVWKRDFAVATAGAVAAAVLAAGLVAYFTPDGGAVPGRKSSVGLVRTAEVALQFVAVGYGPVAFRWFPFDPATVPTLGLVAATGLTAIGVMVAARRKAIGPAATAGALCLLLGYAALAYGLAANRAHDSPTPGYGPRYAVIASFGVVWLVVAGQLVGGRLAASVAGTAAILTGVAWVPSYLAAKPGALAQRAWLSELRDDARAGTPVNFIAHRFAANAGGHREYLESRLRGLRDKGIRPFDTVGDPAGEEFEPIPGAVPDGLTWRFPRGRATGLRLTHSLTGAGGPVAVRVEWRDGDGPWVGRRYEAASGENGETWVWVGAEVDGVRLVPLTGATGTVTAVARVRPRSE